jgi:hypothetical protein
MQIKCPLTPGVDLIDLPLDQYIVEQLRLLDINFYRNHKHDGINADLKNLSDEKLLKHFIERGRIEQRIYNKRIVDYLDPAYYIRAYPHLNLATHAEAQIHWLYKGIFEGKYPNSTTSKMLDADIHLFQMGKVASKSIQNSILAVSPNKLVPHLHFASEILLTYSDCYYSYPEVVSLNNKGIKFLTGVRNPFERVVSGWIEAAGSANSSMSFSDVSQLVANSILYVDLFKDELKRIVNWFDHKFYCDLDIYSTSFDRNKGISITHNGVHHVLAYRLDKLGGLWEDISEFTGLSLSPTYSNLSQNKGEETKLIIDQIKKIKLPQSLVYEVCESRFVKHFFCPCEIKELIYSYSAD